jgi:hypothetical protein
MMVSGNVAQAMYRRDAAGGGVWSNGSLTVENNSAFEGNAAKGVANAYGGAICIAGGTANISDSFFGYGNAALESGWYGGYVKGNAYGGAIYVGAGTVTLNGDIVGNDPGAGSSPSNTASGPSMSFTNKGYGGGLCVAGGSVTLTNDQSISNVAGGFTGGGVAWGGGYGSYGVGNDIYIAPGAQVYIDSFTLCLNRVANHPQIYGSYTLLL